MRSRPARCRTCSTPRGAGATCRRRSWSATPRTLDALAVDIPTWLRTMVEALWPGPLTVICQQQASLSMGSGRHPQHRRGPHARRRARPRAAQADRPARRQQRQHHRRARRSDHRRGRADARRTRRGLPRRRTQRVRHTVDDPGRHRLDTAGPAPGRDHRSTSCTRSTTRSSPRTLVHSARVPRRLRHRSRRHLPAGLDRSAARVPLRRGGPGARPRRARDPDAVLRRSGDARRHHRGLPGRHQPAVPLAGRRRGVQGRPGRRARRDWSSASSASSTTCTSSTR